MVLPDGGVLPHAVLHDGRMIPMRCSLMGGYSQHGALSLRMFLTLLTDLEVLPMCDYDGGVLTTWCSCESVLPNNVH